MSCYMNFHLLPKKDAGRKDNEKYLFLFNISRNHPVYTAIMDNIPIPYGVENYFKINKSMIDQVVEDINEELQHTKNRLVEYEKHCTTIDCVEEILSTKEYLEELQDTLGFILTLQEILLNIESFNWVDFEGMYVTIG